MHSIPFGKFHGLGNNFVLFDCRAHTLHSAATLQKLLRSRDSRTLHVDNDQPLGDAVLPIRDSSQSSSLTMPRTRHPLPPEAVAALCREGLGIGADGIMYALPRHAPQGHHPSCQGSLDSSSGRWIAQCSDVYRPLSNAPGQHVPLQELTMVMNNKDGSIAEMCGNGVRALAYYLFTQDIEHNVVYSFESTIFHPASSGVCYLMHTLAGPKYCYVPPIHSLRDGLLGEDGVFPREHIVVVDMGNPSFTPESIPTLLSPNATIRSLGHSFPALVAVPLPLTLNSMDRASSTPSHHDTALSTCAPSYTSPCFFSSSSSPSSPLSSSPLSSPAIVPSHDSSSPPSLPQHASRTLSPALASLPQQLRRQWRATIVNTGVPHAVIFIDDRCGDVDTIFSSTPCSSSIDPRTISSPREGQRLEYQEEAIEERGAGDERKSKIKEDLWVLIHQYIGVLGPYFCTHPCFPQGCNINFARIRSDTLKGTGMDTGIDISMDSRNGPTMGGDSTAIVDLSTIVGDDMSQSMGRSPSMNMKVADTPVEPTDIMIDALVWERGCGVTQACGTGACAIAVAAQLEGRVGKNDSRNILVKLPGGVMSIAWKCNSHVTYSSVDTDTTEGNALNECKENNAKAGSKEEKQDESSGKKSIQEKMCMTGPATYVFTGNVRL